MPQSTAAAKAQPAWAATNPQRRARVMMKFGALINEHMDELAELVSLEHGKTLPDARGDVQRGLEVVEVCMGAPHLLKGEFTDNGGPGIDLYSMRQPLGVVAGIGALQLPRHDPALGNGSGSGLRQCHDPEAIRAGALHILPPCRIAQGGRLARWRLAGREWRQGNRRRHSGQ